jgi:hypothetical protein
MSGNPNPVQASRLPLRQFHYTGVEGEIVKKRDKIAYIMCKIFNKKRDTDYSFVFARYSTVSSINIKVCFEGAIFKLETDHILKCNTKECSC